MAVSTDGPVLSSSDLLAELAAVVQLVTDVPVSEVLPERRFVDDLRIDSLSMVEILEGVSRRLAVRIEDEDAKDFVRVRDLVDYLAARLTGP